MTTGRYNLKRARSRVERSVTTTVPSGFIPGHLTTAQCDAAVSVVCGNADDARDAVSILESLGLREFAAFHNGGSDA